MLQFLYILKTHLNKVGWYLRETRLGYEIGRTNKVGITVSYLTLSSDLETVKYVYEESLTLVEIRILKNISKSLDFYKIQKESIKKIET